MTKKFGIVSASDLHGVRVAVIVIVFWTGIWNLLENGEQLEFMPNG
jgi:hypothetical protein